MSRDVSHRFLKGKGIGHFIAAVVETKDLFLEVRIRVNRLNRDIPSLQSPLQQAPEVLDALRVYLAAYIFRHVIHRLMDKQTGGIQPLIASLFVSVDTRTPANILQNLVLQRLALRIWDNHRPNLAAVARPHTHNDRFLVAILVSDMTLHVHILRIAADVGLVNLNRVFSVTAEFSRPWLHRLTDAVKHKPS